MSDVLSAWLVRLETAHPKAIDLGLERCGRVYRRLGSPRPARQVWSVAGTNGKGSVSAYLAGLLEAAGNSCGLFTSPHIQAFNERIVVCGKAVSDSRLVAAFERVEQARGATSLTYFEFTTLAALLILSEAALDAAVLEVGLGGRLDAVNLVDADCAVITAIGLDHQDYLGPDRERIGAEKAGIMRRGRPVVVGDVDPPASVLERAAELGCEVWRAGRDFVVDDGSKGDVLEIRGRGMALPRPSLVGRHQRWNAAVAVVALAVLRPNSVLEPAVLSAGIGNTRLPGRLQPFSRDPRIVFDVGHNPLAAKAVVAWLAEQNDARCLCVLGMLADKDVETVAATLDAEIDAWFCAGLGGPRGQDAETLRRRVAGSVRRDVEVSALADVAAALAAARAGLGKQDLVLVFGSFQTVGEAQRALGTVAVNADRIGTE